ncbi:hypothetical protein F4777DRAFT_76178 [Nemania sp. FL0916]|nr:hypothetical protein F4777DRAFT_76178 [Nemania sp. FL0916]
MGAVSLPRQPMTTDFIQNANWTVVNISNNDNEDDQKAQLYLERLVADVGSLMEGNKPGDPSYENGLLQIVEQFDQEQGWHYLLQLFRHSWWTDPRTLQQIIPASKVSIEIGSLSLDLDEIQLILNQGRILELTLYRLQSPTLREIEATPGWCAAKRLLISKLDHEFGDLRIEVLLWRFRKCDAWTSDREKLYVLWDISSHSQPVKNLLRKALVEMANNPLLYFWITRTVLETSKSLEILSIFSAYSNRLSETGTWACSLSATPGRYDRCPLIARGSFGAEDRPGSSFRRPFKADGDCDRVVLLPIYDPRTLTIQGLMFDTVGEMFIPLGSVTREQLVELCTNLSTVLRRLWDTKSDEEIMEIKWRTLLIDEPCGITTEELEKGFLGIFTNYTYHLPHWNGRRIIITAGGRLGLAFDEVQPGDFIVIMPGGSVPYVLRPLPGGTGQWSFIGECYVYGCMDGEIVESASQSAQEWWTDTFDIV